MASIIAHQGEAKAEAWAQRRGRQFRARTEGRRHRPDQGGRGRRMRRGAGQHLLRGASDALDKAEDRKVMEKVGVVWPNQKGYGTHINVSGGGMLKTRAAQGSGASSSSSTWRATRRSAILPTATTNGRSSPASRSPIRRWKRSASSRPTRCRSARWRCTGPRRRSSSTAPAIDKHASQRTAAAARSCAPRDLPRQHDQAAAARPQRWPVTPSRPRPDARRRPACRPAWPAYRS